MLLSFIQNRIREIAGNAFVRNVGILAGGTAFAQMLMAVSLPLLTRLYTPDDFSMLAVYMALLGMITVVSCLRFNIAIALPETDQEAINVAALSLGSAVVVSALLAVPVFVVPDALVQLLGQPGMAPYLWMIPFGVLLASVYTTLQYWTSRRKLFTLIARTQMTRTLGGAGTQLSIGLINPSPFGLIFGHMIHGGLGIVGLGTAIWKKDRALFKALSLYAMRANLRRYRTFPTLSVPEALFNTGGIELPILIIAAAVTGPEAGFLMLAMRVMGLPTGLIGRSVANVYLVEASQKLRDGTLVVFTRQVMLGLFKSGGLLLIAIGAISPFAFPIIFGAEWARAGMLVAWMTPWFVIKFVTTPISTVLHVTGNIAYAMVLQAFGLVFRVGAVLSVTWLAQEWAAEAFAVSGAVFYAAQLLIVMWILRRSVHDDGSPGWADDGPTEITKL